MSGVAAVVLVALLVAGPDLITLAEVLLRRQPYGRHARRDSVWALVSLVVVLHAALGVAAAVGVA